MKSKNLFKAFMCIIISSFFIVPMTACADQSWSVKCEENSLSMGSYILFLQTSYSEAQKKLGVTQNSYATEQKSILNETIEEKKANDWIKDKALENCKNLLATEKKFKELNLSLTNEEEAKAQAETKKAWDQSGSLLEKNGVSKDSYHRTVTLYSIKTEKVFDALYEKNGAEAVSDEDLENYYRENFSNVSIMQKELTSTPEAKKDMNSLADDNTDPANNIPNSEDTEMSEEQINAIKNKFEEYAKNINSGSKTIEKIGEEFKISESSTSDPVKTQSLDMKNSTYSSEVNEAIKALEVKKATMVSTQDTCYLIVKNDITTDIEKLKTEEERKKILAQMKSDDFKNSLQNDIDNMNIEINQRGINKFQPSMFEPKQNNSKNKNKTKTKTKAQRSA